MVKNGLFLMRKTTFVQHNKSQLVDGFTWEWESGGRWNLVEIGIVVVDSKLK
jgi:hypothetical protein